MAENSKIGWTHHTFNPWWGCDKVSAECLHCYIDGIMRRAGYEPFTGPMLTKTWLNPPKWQRKAEQLGKRYRVFTCSMSDFFHQGADAWRPDAWRLIRECDRLDFLVLTKRAERIADCLPPDWGHGYPNVWLGVTCGVRKSLTRLEVLRSIPARIRFVSAEPLLEAVDFSLHLGWLNWIITGCERAAVGKRREMNLDWVRAIDADCRKAGVAHFYKQYYTGNQITEDGVLDGEVRQAWPA